MNATWLEAREKSFEQICNAGVGEFFEWVKIRSPLSRGVTIGTMLQDEAFHFIRLGTLLERADNTARILDVKFHVLRPHGDEGRDRLLPLGRLAALGVGVRGLSQGLPRRDHARTGGRIADPAHGHAALAAFLHERRAQEPAT